MLSLEMFTTYVTTLHASIARIVSVPPEFASGISSHQLMYDCNPEMAFQRATLPPRRPLPTYTCAARRRE